MCLFPCLHIVSWVLVPAAVVLKLKIPCGLGLCKYWYQGMLEEVQEVCNGHFPVLGLSARGYQLLVYHWSWKLYLVDSWFDKIWKSLICFNVCKGEDNLRLLYVSLSPAPSDRGRRIFSSSITIQYFSFKEQTICPVRNVKLRSSESTVLMLFCSWLL